MKAVTVYAFADKRHYADYVVKLHHPSYRRMVTQPDGTVHYFDIEKPMAYVIPVDQSVLSTDFEAIRTLVQDKFGCTIHGCPLCQWSHGHFIWTKPVFIEREKLPHYAAGKNIPNFVTEFWMLCICRMFDIDFVSERDGRGRRYLRHELLQEYFGAFKIDWKHWLSQLEGKEIISGGDNGAAKLRAPERKLIQENFF